MRDQSTPLTHEWIWTAIDTIARRQGLTPSALARIAGLDATAFNRSKRFTTEGRPRWPSTESIAKVLEATKTSLDDFAAIQLADKLEISFDEGEEGKVAGVVIVGEVRDASVANWAPEISEARGRTRKSDSRRRYALAVADGSLEPVYSRGNTLVVSEAAAPRDGDRVLVKPAGMRVLPRLLVRSSPTEFEFDRFGSTRDAMAIKRQHIDWMARIVLVRQ